MRKEYELLARHLIETSDRLAGETHVCVQAENFGEPHPFLEQFYGASNSSRPYSKLVSYVGRVDEILLAAQRYLTNLETLK